MSNYLKEMEVGKAYVVSLKKLANIIANEMEYGDVLTFGTEWDEDEFVMDVGKVSYWYGFTISHSPFTDYRKIVTLGRWDSNDVFCFSYERKDIDEIIKGLKKYLRNCVDETTINGYVCLDPENLRKDKREEEEDNG